MNSFKRFVFLAALVAPAANVFSAAAYTQDTGTISQVYVSAAGTLSVRLDGGFPNAVADGQCPGNNGWAGVLSTVDANIKSSLLMAKISGDRVVVTISGCQGAWFKIVDVYVK